MISWKTGGTSVVDFEDPATPQELAHYTPADAGTWSSYWYKGRIYVSDAHAFEILEVKGLKDN